VSDPASQTFYLPPLAAKFLRNKRPEAVAQTGDRLADRAYALALENGYGKHERFPLLEAEWPVVAAALPRLVGGENARLQELCDALTFFLEFSGRWDERLGVEQQAEQKALAVNDSYNAGWRAYRIGWVHYLRGEAAGVLACAARAEAHWQKANAGVRERAGAIRLRGVGLEMEKKYPAAIAAYRQALDLWRTLAAESQDVASALSDIADIERKFGDHAAAERDYREALRIAKNGGHREGVAYITAGGGGGPAGADWLRLFQPSTSLRPARPARGRPALCPSSSRDLHQTAAARQIGSGAGGVEGV
jgi:tetratricopeptide (TPR) repeat protein